MKKLLMLVAVALPLVAISANAGTITVVSDGNVLSAATAWDSTLLDSASGATGLTFVPVLVGAWGTFTPVPTGAPNGTQVINIPTPYWDPNQGEYVGESGYFEVTFNLPAGYGTASLAGLGNADDFGRAFLNGNPISPPLYSGITEFGNYAFSTSNQSYFVTGTNTFLLSDLNTGGPSGTAFYFTVTYGTPEPGTLALLGSGLLAGAGVVRRKLMS